MIHKGKHKDESWLKQRYIVDRKTTREIGIECGTNGRIVCGYLRKFGILARDSHVKAEMIGRVFGELTCLREVDRPVKARSNYSYYLFRCSCGDDYIANGNTVRMGLTRRCGKCGRAVCAKPNSASQHWSGTGEISGFFWNRVVKRYGSRRIETTMGIDSAWKLFVAQKRKCAYTGLGLTFPKRSNNAGSKIEENKGTASLDRIDSSRGYVEGNVQWVHKDINRMKLDYSHDYFLSLCSKIATYDKSPSVFQTENLTYGKGAGPNNPRWKGCGEISGHFWNDIRWRSKKRKISMELTIEYVWELFIEQNRTCALSGMTLTFSTSQGDRSQTASLDRIDSNRGYILGNVQWVHKDINMIKQTLSNGKLLYYCRLIAKTANRPCCLQPQQPPP